MDFYKTLESVLKTYNRFSDVPAQEFLEEQVFQGEPDAKSLAQRICRTIDLVSQKHAALQEWKQAGGGREDWLAEEMAPLLADENAQEVVAAFKGKLTSSLQVSGRETAPLQGFNERQVAKNLIEDLRQTTFLGAIVADEKGLAIDIQHSEIRIAQEYYQRAMHAPGDDEVKKVVAGGLVLASQEGLLPDWIDQSPEALSLIADRGLEYSKLAYKVAIGEFEPMDAVNFMVDRTVAQVSGVITHYTATLGTELGSSVGAMLGSVLGPAGSAFGFMVGSAVGYAGGRALGQKISEGVAAVGSAVKSVVGGVVEAASSFVSSVASWVFG